MILEVSGNSATFNLSSAAGCQARSCRKLRRSPGIIDCQLRRRTRALRGRVECDSQCEVEVESLELCGVLAPSTQPTQTNTSSYHHCTLYKPSKSRVQYLDSFKKTDFILYLYQAVYQPPLSIVYPLLKLAWAWVGQYCQCGARRKAAARPGTTARPLPK